MDSKTTVADIYRVHGFSAYLIDQKAGVPPGTTNLMRNNVPVSRHDAERVLALLSIKLMQDYSFDNVEVEILPPFGDIYVQASFSITDLEAKSGVSYAVISDMIGGRPVQKWMAEKVLQALSSQTGTDCTLENVDVALTKEMR